MSEILLLRHGETLWNIEGRIQGHRDSPLSADGLAQAEALAQCLAIERPDFLYSSDLGRALRTAEPIARATGLVPRVDPDLRERNYGVFEGRTWPEIECELPRDYAVHARRTPTEKMAGGESMLEFRDRAVGALSRIAESGVGAKIAIVTHGGVLGALYRHIAGIPLDAPRSFEIPNAGVNRFSYRAGVWRLIAWGDVSHIGDAVPLLSAAAPDSRFA